MKNEWLWLETEVFSASSAYRVRLEDIGQIEDFIVFQDLWKVKVPPMVLFMIQRVLINRLPMCDNLFKRNIVLVEEHILCPFCKAQFESTSHILFTCARSNSIWKYYYNWMYIATVLPESRQQHFLQHYEAKITQGGNDRWKIIWVGVVCLWRLRNNCVFNGGVFSFQKLIKGIKYFAWWWMKVRDIEFNFSFSQWASNLIVCLNNCGF